MISYIGKCDLKNFEVPIGVILPEFNGKLSAKIDIETATGAV